MTTERDCSDEPSLLPRNPEEKGTGFSLGACRVSAALLISDSSVVVVITCSLREEYCVVMCH